MCEGLPGLEEFRFVNHLVPDTVRTHVNSLHQFGQILTVWLNVLVGLIVLHDGLLRVPGCVLCYLSISCILAEQAFKGEIVLTDSSEVEFCDVCTWFISELIELV